MATEELAQAIWDDLSAKLLCDTSWKETGRAHDWDYVKLIKAHLNAQTADLSKEQIADMHDKYVRGFAPSDEAFTTLCQMARKYLELQRALEIVTNA